MDPLSFASILLSTTLQATPAAPARGPAWTSPNGFRILLAVDTRNVDRSNSPASVDIDFAKALARLQVQEAFRSLHVQI